MRIYFDACCLHPPFDDQSQERVRLESEAILLLMEACKAGIHQWVCSRAIVVEVRRNPDEERRSMVQNLLEYADERLAADKDITRVAREFARQGIGAMDALHLAEARCDVFITTDDILRRRSRQLRPPLSCRVENPLSFMLETEK
jgi:hypothetical protein